jgi:ABC-type antimicrobial peptide transport system permease subunit
MVIYYLKSVWRNLAKNKAFSAINIAGLALGMACSLLIFLWVRDEQNMDKFHTHGQNLYLVYERVFSAGKLETGPWTPGMLAQELKRKFPEIRYASAFWNNDEGVFEAKNKQLAMKGAYADSDFLKMFSYRVIEGTPQSALTGPNDIAISRKMANIFFGSPAAAFGQPIRYNDTNTLRVAAVFEDLPTTSSDKFDFLLDWNLRVRATGWLSNWIYRGPETYIELRSDASPQNVEARIKDFVAPYLKADGSGYKPQLGLQRFDQKYLNSRYDNGVPSGGRADYVRLFTLVALFILLIACINFMNLATARSVRRAKEVGVRKTIGASRARLILQFMGEAMMLAFFAIVLAFALAILLMPAFNDLTGKQLILPVSSRIFWLEVSILLLTTGLVAGSYPAFFLSSLQPIKVLKGALKFSLGALNFRKGLVIFQFVLSISFIISTIVVARQVNYVQHANLGYDRENMIYIPFQGNLANRFNLFRQELDGRPGIQSVTLSTQAPSQIYRRFYDMDWEGKDPNQRLLGIHNGIGYDFVNLMGLKIVEGREFSRDFPEDTTRSNIIINETLAKLTGYKQPIGKWLTFFQQRCKIIGVVKDFNLGSLHDPIQPLVLYWAEKDGWGGALVRTNPGQTGEAIASMGKVFKQLEPKFPFRYEFTDEEYRRLYNDEQTTGMLSSCFSLLAIIISCLGLLGLVIFATEQRRKEIGVRKVVGARVVDIVLLLSRDIVRLVLIATLIATPLAWLVMRGWLDDFAYRVPLSWWIFLDAGVGAVLFALLTISFQTIKAALANPVKSLRSE